MIEVRFDKIGLAVQLLALSKNLPMALGAALKNEGNRINKFKSQEYAQNESVSGKDSIKLVKQ